MTSSLLERSPAEFFVPIAPPSERVVVLDALSYAYPNFRLGPFSLGLERGARCALVGRNGAGKTTLLSLLSGQRAPQSGTGSICGQDLNRERIAIRERVALTGDAVRGCGWMTVREHFTFLSRFFDGWRMDAALDLARGLDVPLDKTLVSLSRGTGVKVALCSAWGQGAQLLLLDEPTAGLDPIARVEFLRELERLLAGTPDLTVVVATHILEDLDHLAISDLLILRDGRCEHIEPDVPIPPGGGGAIVRRIFDIDSRGEL
jgi:ABC-2 type transport system ATP-binding protein